MIGKPYGRVALFARPKIELLALYQRRAVTRENIEEQLVTAGDRLVLLAPAAEVMSLHLASEIRVGADRRRRVKNIAADVFEAVIAPSQRGVHRALGDVDLPGRFGVVPLAVHRYRHLPGPDLASVQLRAADVLLMAGSQESINRMVGEGGFLDIGNARARPFRRRKAPIAIATLIAVVVLAALDIMPIGGLALIGCTVILATGCIDLNEALSSIDGSLLGLIFGMLVIGEGLENTGTVELIVGLLAPWLESASPLALLFGLYLLCAILTEIVTNNAVAALMTPLAIGLAEQAGVDPRPLVVAVMFAASASFATPIGYQTNTLVYGAGNYRFSDFLKIGVPMNLIAWLATCVAISILMPL